MNVSRTYMQCGPRANYVNRPMDTWVDDFDSGLYVGCLISDWSFFRMSDFNEDDGGERWVIPTGRSFGNWIPIRHLNIQHPWQVN